MHTSTPPSRRSLRATGMALFGICFVVYLVMSYGGTRSPDSEVVFRTGEALALHGRFGLPEELPWKNFGVPQGKDGYYYSLFGPGQSIAMAPFIKVAAWINATGWYEGKNAILPLSHFVDQGLAQYAKGEIPEDIEPHALRFIVSIFNPLITAITAILFFLMLHRLTGSFAASLWTSILFSLGSLALPYATTFFSEPLATLFVVASFYLLVCMDENRVTTAPRRALLPLGSGLLLGMAFTTHITAILFAPFFLMYLAYVSWRDGSVRSTVRQLALWGAGLAVIMLFIGYFNYARFGSFLETGRTASNRIYGIWGAPWMGLSGLLWSSGKGLFFYCPAVVIGLILWRSLYRNRAVLSLILLAAAVFRLVFIAGRSDWHAGFCIGPRYLIMLIPFLLIPVAFYLKEQITQNNKTGIRVMGALTAVCAAQQVYFCMGEIFTYWHNVKWAGMSVGLDVFKDDFIYLDWNTTPLLFLLDWQRSPFLLLGIPLGNRALWLVLVALITGGLVLAWKKINLQSGTGGETK